jgi:hypothetical protein
MEDSLEGRMIFEVYVLVVALDGAVVALVEHPLAEFVD